MKWLKTHEKLHNSEASKEKKIAETSMSNVTASSDDRASDLGHCLPQKGNLFGMYQVLMKKILLMDFDL